MDTSFYRESNRPFVTVGEFTRGRYCSFAVESLACVAGVPFRAREKSGPSFRALEQNARHTNYELNLQ